MKAVLLISLLFMAGTAQADPPFSVDLSTELGLKPRRDFGATCHISAAAALLEASCRRVTGQPVSVSQTAMLVDHLISELRSPQNRGALLRSRHGNELTPLDAGYEGRDLLQALDGGARNRERAEREKTVLEQVDHLFRKAKDDADREGQPYRAGGALAGVALAGLLSHVALDLLSKPADPPGSGPCRWRQLLNGAVSAGGVLAGNVLGTQVGKSFTDDSERREQLAKNLRANADLLLAAQDQSPALKACLGSGLQPYHAQSPSPQWLRKLLEAKIPFLCSGTFKADHRVVRPSPDDVTHVGLAVGYERDPEIPGGARFLIQNGDGGKPALWEIPAGGCPVVTVLFRPQEAQVFGAAMYPITDRTFPK